MSDLVKTLKISRSYAERAQELLERNARLPEKWRFHWKTASDVLNSAISQGLEEIEIAMSDQEPDDEEIAKLRAEDED